MNLSPFEIGILIFSALAAIALVVHFVHTANLATLEARLKTMIQPSAPAQPVDHAAIVNAAANVVAAATGASAPAATPARATFDPSLYTDPAARVAAFQALRAQVGIGTPIYTPSGNKVDSSGKEIVPDTTPDKASGFDFGTVPNAQPKRNTLDGGKIYAFTFAVATAQKMRLGAWSERSQGKPDFDNFSFTIKLGDQVVADVKQPANTGESFVPLPELQPGNYTMNFSVDKTDLVGLQFLPAG